MPNPATTISVVPEELKIKSSSHEFIRVVDEALRARAVDVSTTERGQHGTPQCLHGAEYLANWVVRIDPQTWEDICVLREGYRTARDKGDDQAMEYMLLGIRRAIDPRGRPAPVDFSAWRDQCLSTEERRVANARIQLRLERFYDHYAQLKEKCGFRTYKEVAERAGVSKTTVVAIENRRGKPQFQTIKKLARAFGVDASDLL